MKKFYITTPIYYVNAKPHIGHAYTTIATDVLARFHKLQGEDVFFLTGTDEHGLKIQKEAEKAGKDPQKFVDEIAQEFKILWDKLNIKYDNFIRTTNKNHKKAVQKVLQTLYDKGAIYKGEYEGLYCVGCEQYKNESDLVNGKCPEHDMEAEKVKEECYMLKMKDLQSELVKKIETDEFKIAPEKYKNEILSFLKNQKLNDISVSRKNVKWGVSLPFAPEQTAYVWIDAFLNYLTGLGWSGDPEEVRPLSTKTAQRGQTSIFWPPNVQLIGKDILRVHATIWPIILMHLGAQLPSMIFTHGFLLLDGRKMSKTLGNVITIEEMLEKFGVDGTRYLLMSAGTFGDDCDITMERLTEKYNADLANGLGNLISRVIKMSERLQLGGEELFKEIINCTEKNINLEEIKKWYQERFSKFKLEQVLRGIWLGTSEDYYEEGKLVSHWTLKGIKQMNEYIEKTKPWELKENSKQLKESIIELFSHLMLYSNLLAPFMPKTSEKIKKALETKKVKPLFQRIK